MTILGQGAPINYKPHAPKPKPFDRKLLINKPTALSTVDHRQAKSTGPFLPFPLSLGAVGI